MGRSVRARACAWRLQYEMTYAGRIAPRSPSWNLAPQPDKHWLLRQIVAMDGAHTNESDIFFQRRWSVLRSVDDMVERFHDMLAEAGVWDNTFFVYSSDHGYHVSDRPPVRPLWLWLAVLEQPLPIRSSVDSQLCTPERLVYPPTPTPTPPHPHQPPPPPPPPL